MKKLLLAFTVYLWGINANAQILDSEHRYWNVFTLKQDNGTICYMTSTPIKKSGNYTRRSEPYFLVTHRSRGIAEISASSGYPYKKNSVVTIDINRKSKFTLFTSPETPKIAWAQSEAEDKTIIKRMIQGTKMTVHGISQKGTFSKDTFSLMGFSKAYKRMNALCR